LKENAGTKTGTLEFPGTAPPCCPLKSSLARKPEMPEKEFKNMHQ
jgi:hypothetical protein